MIPIQMPTVRRLKQRREAIATLCDALENFLSLDVDADLETFERMQTAPRAPSVTPEMLVNAQTELENSEAQLDAIRKMRDNFPEKLAPMFDSCEQMFTGLFSSSIDSKRSYVKMLQNQLDGKTCSIMCECGASLMADGSANRGFVQPGDMFAGTREECDAKARESGWNVEGADHTCPECARG